MRTLLNGECNATPRAILLPVYPQNEQTGQLNGDTIKQAAGAHEGQGGKGGKGGKRKREASQEQGKLCVPEEPV